MSHFYGTVEGQAQTTATRRGSKKSGLVTHAASWDGAVRVQAYYNEYHKEDWVRVWLTTWHGSGVQPDVCLYHGPLGEYAPIQVTVT